MTALDKAALLACRLPEEAVEVPALGGTVRVRSLSRAEVLEMRGKEVDVAAMERRLLALALVAPVLTEDEVGQWQAASTAGELEPITKAIMRLSGLEDAADKAAMQRFRS